MNRLTFRYLLVAAALVLVLAGSSSAARAASRNDVSTAQCKMPGPVPAGCVVIVFDGDSISAGIGAAPTDGLDAQFVRDLRVPARVYNVAVGGRPVFECLRLFGTTVAPLHDPAAPANLIVFHAGDNDIAQGKSADETYRAFTEYVAAAHAQGWKIVVSTELRRFAFSAERQAALEAYNQRLRANAAGADAVVDLDRDPRLAQPIERDDPALFTKDRVHPSAGGYAVIAELVAAAAKPLLPR